MKKVGLILLALVIALGALGVGYARWSDSVTVTGTVSTGDVDIDLNAQGYSGTYIYKNLTNDDLVRTTVASTLSNYFLVASAEATAGTAENSVVMKFKNLFPMDTETEKDFCAGFTATYAGTIPVHVAWDWALLNGSNPVAPQNITDLALKELLYYYSTIEYTVIRANGTQYSGTLAPADNQLIQLHTGDQISVSVNIEVPQTWYKDTPNTSFVIEDANTQADLQGKSFDFVGKFVAYQWNESAPATILP